MPQQPLGDLDEVVLAIVRAQILAGVAKLLDRLGGHALFRVQLRELDPGRDVVGIEVDQLANRRQRLFGLTFAMEVGRDALEVLHRVRQQPQLAVQLGQLEVDVDQARVELEDLLVDRDGLEVEALLAVELRDLEIGLGRLGLGALFGVQVADLEPDADVLRVLLNDLEVLLDRLVGVTLLDELAGRIHGLVLVESHDQPARVPSLSGALRVHT